MNSWKTQWYKLLVLNFFGEKYLCLIQAMYLGTYVRLTYMRNKFIFMCFNEQSQINIELLGISSHKWRLVFIIIKIVSRLYSPPPKIPLQVITNIINSLFMETLDSSLILLLLSFNSNNVPWINTLNSIFSNVIRKV